MEDWGMVLHPERRDVMSVNTGLLALAEARYGRLDQALRLVRKTASALDLRTPGAISEALPDRWCFLQLWSAVGIISPLVEGVFGVAPCAADRRLRVVSSLPAGWDHAELRNVRIGKDHFDIRLALHDGVFQTDVAGSGRFDLQVGWVIPEGSVVSRVELDGRAVQWQVQPGPRGQEVVCNAAIPARLCIRQQ
jgi:hypothetical protein